MGGNEQLDRYSRTRSCGSLTHCIAFCKTTCNAAVLLYHFVTAWSVPPDRLAPRHYTISITTVEKASPLGGDSLLRAALLQMLRSRVSTGLMAWLFATLCLWGGLKTISHSQVRFTFAYKYIWNSIFVDSLAMLSC